MSDPQKEMELAKASRQNAQEHLQAAEDDEDRDYWRRVVGQWDVYIRRLEADLRRGEG